MIRELDIPKLPNNFPIHLFSGKTESQQTLPSKPNSNGVERMLPTCYLSNVGI